MFSWMFSCCATNAIYNPIPHITSVQFLSDCMLLNNIDRLSYSHLKAWDTRINGVMLIVVHNKPTHRWIPSDTPEELAHSIELALANYMCFELKLALSVDQAMNVIRKTNRGLYCVNAPSSKNECPICMEPLDVAVRLLNCNHIFHPTCARKWHTRGGRTCSICRQSSC